MDKRISHFEILDKIDEGGMGKVYLAKDTDLNRKVALKFLPRQFTSERILIDRFKREAQAAAALKHPNIVTIYEMGRHKEDFYIAMEFIDGISLNDLLNQRNPSTKKALLIAIQIGRGLRKAHEAGIIHRDIKPANIMIDKDGWVKILDFGLAKLTESTRITRYGVRMGTAPYISPEQLKGEELEPSSDIFSLGVLLYQLLAGRHPFDGNTEEEIMYSILRKKPIPLAKHKSGITTGLQAIVDKALKKDPQMRYQSVEQFLSDVKREKRIYDKRKKAVAKNLKTTETLGLTIKDIRSNIFRISFARVKTSLHQLCRSRLRMNRLGFKKFAIPVWLLFIVAITAGAAFSFYGLQRKAAQRIATKINPVETLLSVKKTPELLLKFKELRNEKLISVGKNVDFTSLENRYLFIFDQNTVLDVFEIKDNLFSSMHSRETFTAPPNRFSGVTKIWVQDLTVEP